MAAYKSANIAKERIYVFFFALGILLKSFTYKFMFKRMSGKPNIEWYPIATSQVSYIGGLMYWNSSGALIPADATSGMHAGIALRAVLSTDADYASAKKIPVDVPNDNDIFELDFTGTSVTTAMVGNKYDISSSLLGNCGATSKKVITIVGFISTTKALVKINSMITNEDIATT